MQKIEEKVIMVMLVWALSVPMHMSAAMGDDGQWLQYRRAEETDQVVGPASPKKLELNGQEPEGVDLPEFKGHNPLYARWLTPMVKSGHLWLAFERSHKYGLYNRLFIDSDADGHLNDEVSTSAHRTDPQRAYFGPVKVTLDGEDGPITYHLNFEFFTAGDRPSVWASSGGWYEGAIIVGDVKKHCTLTDQNANGTFHDKLADPEESDRIWIHAGKTDEGDLSLVGNYIQVDGELYRLKIAKDGAYVKLAKADDAIFGNVRVQEAISKLTAGGENGLLDARPVNGITRLPVGQYRLLGWVIERKDEKNNIWKLEAMDSNDRDGFKVTEASGTTLRIGEPIISKLEAMRDHTKHFFRCAEMKGQLGEYIHITCNGGRPPPPKLHIRSSDGKYTRTYSFEYG